jgi:hypothetical protein
MHRVISLAALAITIASLAGCANGSPQEQAKQEAENPCAFNKPVACEHEKDLEKSAEESKRLTEEQANGASQSEAEAKANEYQAAHPEIQQGAEEYKHEHPEGG